MCKNTIFKMIHCLENERLLSNILYHLLHEFRLDPADALIGVGNYLIHDKCTLEDREFGRLAEVVDALKITQIKPRQTQRGRNTSSSCSLVCTFIVWVLLLLLIFIL